MARILLAYEFGAGLGHLGILSSVAKQFKGRHRLAFAVPDIPLATAHLSHSLGHEITVRQSPKWSGVETVISKRGTYCYTLAETLALFGFDDSDRLQAACEIWFTIIREERPDIIIVDSAPTARLALEARVPMVVVGTGYTVLPSERVLPSLRPWQPLVPPHSRAIEARICAAVNDRRVALKGSGIDYVGDLFRGDKTFVSTLPEFDPYKEFRASDPYMPFNIPSYQSGPSFDLRTGPAIFAYFPSVHPAVLPVIEALNDSGVPSHLYLSNAHADKVANLCHRHVRVHAKPAEFSAILPQTRLVIHHAGLGTTLAAMAAGAAQLTLSAMLENQITGIGLEASGSSINIQVPPVPNKKDIRVNIDRLMQGVSYREGAANNAKRIEILRELDPMMHVAKAVDAFLP